MAAAVRAAAVLLLAAAARPCSCSSSMTRSNVAPILTDAGMIIDAHETQIVQHEAGGLWYMYAMKYALCRSGPTHKSGKSLIRVVTLPPWQATPIATC